MSPSWHKLRVSLPPRQPDVVDGQTVACELPVQLARASGQRRTSSELQEGRQKPRFSGRVLMVTPSSNVQSDPGGHGRQLLLSIPLETFVLFSKGGRASKKPRLQTQSALDVELGSMVVACIGHSVQAEASPAPASLLNRPRLQAFRAPDRHQNPGSDGIMSRAQGLSPCSGNGDDDMSRASGKSQSE